MVTFTDVDFDERSLDYSFSSLIDEVDLNELNQPNICHKSKDPEIRAAIEALDRRKRELRGAK